jgi:hypothetical protein
LAEQRPEKWSRKALVTATINGKISGNEIVFVFLTASKSASSGVLME